MLDTNVVLDWLLFRDAAIAPMAQMITVRQARWVATDAMRQELEHVLGRSRIAAWHAASADILAGWAHWVEPAVARSPSLAQPLRCSDTDDQKFIDLALQVGAAALLSRDRAVLKLAGRAKATGLDIVTPATWARQRGSAARASVD
ncbi:MAG: PIN domain-containing protein [Burkholderiaceae bacterium]